LANISGTKPGKAACVLAPEIYLDLWLDEKRLSIPGKKCVVVRLIFDCIAG
jgi:hypothetical protein